MNNKILGYSFAILCGLVCYLQLQLTNLKVEVAELCALAKMQENAFIVLTEILVDQQGTLRQLNGLSEEEPSDFNVTPRVTPY